MLSYDEVKNFGKKAGKKQSDREKLLKGSEPAKEAMYKKWQETKVAGGTVNPIISTDSKVKENETLTGRKEQKKGGKIQCGCADRRTGGQKHQGIDFRDTEGGRDNQPDHFRGGFFYQI